ncbi:hypothetical protein AB0I72_28090 [Nocardiopsis sp. NPDC049922]|uniref:hypothetical protein n=1 Tax=Nocardiopsis sp. NPDC049922 TaxID=3155157 RepID=UPI0033F9627D
MDDTIFQPSDLAGAKRTEFLDAAREGLARLRDKDGTSLVMLPESKLQLLQTLAKWWECYTNLESVLQRGARPKVADLGELAWLRQFDLDDLREFSDELHEALIAAGADGDARVLNECVHQWHVTARQLEDPLRCSILLGNPVSEDFIEVDEPNVDG